MRNAVREVDLGAAAAMDAVITPLRRRLDEQRAAGKRPRLRPEHSHDAVRAWRSTVPATGRLYLSASATDESLHIAEIRASATKARRLLWGEEFEEPGLGIVLIAAIIDREHIHLCNEILAVVSLHALARRFQRGFDNSPAAVANDMLAVGTRSHEIAINPATDFSIPVSDGCWLGEVCKVRDENGVTRMPSVRTFV